ncbi:nodulation protein NodZ [Magnetococcus sp. PR-3]|uniref:nodulation protein NodZ n=1 Tax=Magnetococcus sp. PR-3 TaxID=3120355 RepID=UPI002FCE64BD
MQKFIITRKQTGIGSDLVSVICALNYAIQTGRHLIIDWRQSIYIQDPSINLFLQLFHIPNQIEGIRVFVAAPQFDDSSLPTPILHSDQWPFEDYHHAMLEGIDRPEPTLLITRPMHHLPSEERQAELFRYIQPAPRLAQKIQPFQTAHFSPRPVIGVHIRHGNGERLGQGRDALIELGIEGIYTRIMHTVARITDQPHSLLLCTDSLDLRQYAQAHHPHLIYWDSQLLADNQGPIHNKAFDLQGAEDAVIEMWLLAATQGLIYNPSWFSHYGRMVGQFITPALNIDEQSKYGTNQIYFDRLLQSDQA